MELRVRLILKIKQEVKTEASQTILDYCFIKESLRHTDETKLPIFPTTYIHFYNRNSIIFHLNNLKKC